MEVSSRRWVPSNEGDAYGAELSAAPEPSIGLVQKMPKMKGDRRGEGEGYRAP